MKISIQEIFASITGNSTHNFTKGSIAKAVILLSIPMVLEMSMEAIFALADIIFLMMHGTQEAAIAGLTETMMTIVYSMGMGIAIATTAMVSRRIGENNPEKASKVAMQGIIAGSLIGLILAIPGIFFAEELLTFMGASSEAIKQGAIYTRILLGVNIIIMWLFINNAILRSSGDAGTALKVLVVANGINIVLDPCLIFGLGPFPELGILGAALATTIGRSIAVAYQFYLLYNGSQKIKLMWQHVQIHWQTMIQLLKLASGTIGQFIIMTSSWILLARLVAHYGDDAIAGYTVAVRVVLFTILPSWGMSNAAATLVGQNLGAGQPERAEKSTWIAAYINMAFLAVVAGFFVFIPEQILSLIIHDNAKALETGVNCMRILGYGYVFYGLGMVLIQALNGAGDTLTPTILNAICFWLISIPLAYFMALNLDLKESGVFLSLIISETIMSIAALIIFKRGKWKKVKV